MTYIRGHVKRNPLSGEVAIRTVFPEGQSPEEKGLEWLCAGWGTSPRNTTTQEVEGWDDLYVPDLNASFPGLILPSPSILDPVVKPIPEFNP